MIGPWVSTEAGCLSWWRLQTDAQTFSVLLSYISGLLWYNISVKHLDKWAVRVAVALWWDAFASLKLLPNLHPQPHLWCQLPGPYLRRWPTVAAWMFSRPPSTCSIETHDQWPHGLELATWVNPSLPTVPHWSIWLPWSANLLLITQPTNHIQFCLHHLGGNPFSLITSDWADLFTSYRNLISDEMLMLMCTIQVHMPCQDCYSRHISCLLYEIMCHKAFGVGVITADICFSCTWWKCNDKLETIVESGKYLSNAHK